MAQVGSQQEAHVNEERDTQLICPQCDAEYRRGFARCADCDIPLTCRGADPTSSEAGPAMVAPRWVRLRQTGDAAELPLVTSLLDGARIPFTLQGAHACGLLGGQTMVWVPERRR